MKCTNHFVYNSLLEKMLSQKEETLLYDRVKKEHYSVKGPDRERFELLQKLEHNISVQVLNDYRSVKEIMSKEINDCEWNDKFESMQIMINDIYNLPNRFVDATLRAWFYIQLLCIKNNRSVIDITEEQANAIISLEFDIYNNPKLEELHNLYLEYYKNIMCFCPEYQAQESILNNFRILINKKVTEINMRKFSLNHELVKKI
ncbi:MAG: hypothetical protein ACI31M_02250 [Bacilli bacterium]